MLSRSKNSLAVVGTSVAAALLLAACSSDAGEATGAPGKRRGTPGKARQRMWCPQPPRSAHWLNKLQRAAVVRPRH